jgi:hypothetical protein
LDDRIYIYYKRNFEQILGWYPHDVAKELLFDLTDDCFLQYFELNDVEMIPRDKEGQREKLNDVGFSRTYFFNEYIVTLVVSFNEGLVGVLVYKKNFEKRFKEEVSYENDEVQILEEEGEEPKILLESSESIPEIDRKNTCRIRLGPVGRIFAATSGKFDMNHGIVFVYKPHSILTYDIPRSLKLKDFSMFVVQETHILDPEFHAGVYETYPTRHLPQGKSKPDEYWIEFENLKQKHKDKVIIYQENEYESSDEDKMVQRHKNIKRAGEYYKVRTTTHGTDSWPTSWIDNDGKVLCDSLTIDGQSLMPLLELRDKPVLVLHITLETHKY